MSHVVATIYCNVYRMEFSVKKKKKKIIIFKQDHRKSIENLSGYSPVSVYVWVRDGKR